MFFILLLIFFIFFQVYTYETIVLSYYDLNKGKVTQLYFGEPPMAVSGVISLSKRYSILLNKAYHREFSSTVKLYSSNETMEHVYDIIRTNKGYKDSNSFLSFYLYNNETIQYDTSVFGFSYKFEECSCSIVHQLYEKGIIKELGFGISPLYDEDQGDLYIGKLPSYVSDLKQKGICDVNKNYSEWNCKVRYTYIGNEKYKGYHLNRVGIFVSDRRDIIVGKNLWKHLEKKIFKKYYFANKTCEYDNMTNNQYTRIKCKCLNMKDFPQIIFIIGNYELAFKNWDLFSSNAFSVCRFHIIYDKHNIQDSIIIGTAFYRNYFIYFNYELSQISFLSYQKIMETDLDDSFLNQKEIPNIYYKINTCLILSCILSFNFFFLIYYKYNLIKYIY